MNRPVPAIQPRLWTRRSMLLALAGAGLSVPACEFSQLFSWNGGKPVLFGYSTAPNFDRRYKTIRVKIFKNPTMWAVVPVPGLEEELTEAIVHQIEQITPYKVDSGDADLELSGQIVSFLQISVNYNQLNEVRQIETTLICAVVLKDLRTGKLLSAPQLPITEPPPPAGLLPGQLDPLNSPTLLPGSMQTMELSAAPISPAGNAATLAQTSPPPTTGNPYPGQTNAPGAPGGVPGAPGGVPGVPGSAGAALGNLPGGMPTSLIGAVLVRSTASYAPEIGQSLATAEQDNCNMMAQQIVNMMESGW